MRPKWEIHVPNWVPNWGLTLWQWLLFEWWIKILFAIRKYQFVCSTTQICAQHGVLNENFLQKVAAKFNLTVFRGSFSRLTFWVRRRTCLSMTTVYPWKLSKSAFLQILATKMPYLNISATKMRYFHIFVSKIITSINMGKNKCLLN